MVFAKRVLTAALVIGVSLLCGCAVSAGGRAPDWTLRDIHDQQHHLADYEGKVVLLDFWATWCAPCLVVSPHMQTLHEKYSDQGLAVIAIHFDNQGDPARYMKKHGYTFDSMVNGSEVAERYGVAQIPTILIISREGKVVHRQTGFAADDVPRIEAIIKGQLETPD